MRLGSVSRLGLGGAGDIRSGIGTCELWVASSVSCQGKFMLSQVSGKELAIKVAKAPAISSSVIRCEGSLAISDLTGKTDLNCSASAGNRQLTQKGHPRTDQAEQITPLGNFVIRAQSESRLTRLFKLEKLGSFRSRETSGQVVNVVHAASNAFRVFRRLAGRRRISSASDERHASIFEGTHEPLV